MNWEYLLTLPGIIFFIPIVAIVCGCLTAIVKMLIQHRERMGMIEQGLHPDCPPDDEPGQA